MVSLGFNFSDYLGSNLIRTILNWSDHELDVKVDMIYDPTSLFIEAVKNTANIQNQESLADVWHYKKQVNPIEFCP